MSTNSSEFQFIKICMQNLVLKCAFVTGPRENSLHRKVNMT